MKRLLLTLTLLFATISSNYAQAEAPNGGFGVNAYYVDCRAQVPTMEALKTMVADISRLGLNALVMEWEATFPFEQHGTLINEFAFTREQIEDFVAYSNNLGVDIIPLQNCFGHAEYILRHDRYYALREDIKEISQLCPLKGDLAKPIFEEIFKDVADLHTSQYIHIGADETYLLGSCRHCKAIADKHGKSKLFVDYVNTMSEIILSMGKTPLIWADIILKYPESVDQLSKDIIFVDWNYGWDVDKFGDLQPLFDAGITMWGASSLRSHPDNMYITQWMKHFDNLTTFMPHARKYNYQGMIQTSWSTSGVYGHQYGHPWEILGMQPVRLVYPAHAFNIILEAYAQATQNADVFNPQEFILQYAVGHFGVEESSAVKLYNYMSMPQEVIRREGKDDKGTPIEEVIAAAQSLRTEFATFGPKRNKAEYENLVLMLDIRINYLLYKQIHAKHNSAEYRRTDAAALLSQLSEVIKESSRIEKRFRKLNKNFLKDGQWDAHNLARTETMMELQRTLEASL
ncbi:MAG: family 20 glycosylhydrolase [Rikenellaceae bacterium]